MPLEPTRLEVTVRRRVDGGLEAYIIQEGRKGPNILPARRITDLVKAKEIVTRTFAKLASGIEITWKIEDSRP